MKAMKKIWIGFIAILMTLTMSSCSLAGFFLGFFSTLFGEMEISLEYTLTEDDLTEFTELVQECEELALKGNNILSINMSFSEMTELYEYIEAQAFIGYIEYCRDQTSETAIAHYTESERIMASVRTQYLAMLKKLAEESPIKDELFAGWTEQDMAMLLADNELISALQLENSEIERDFYALPEDENWSKNVSELYEESVENNQEMAAAYGYDNYYAFASEMVYGRTYSAEQRESFRGFVAEYLVPLYVEVFEAYKAGYLALTEAQQNAYEQVYGNGEYLNGYIHSFGGSINDKMNAMFERTNACIFEDNENALQGAFVSYINYFEQPLAYFGPGYQDVLTIVHEMGHYVSLYYFDNATLPYDLAETHSQGSEWLFMAYLEEYVDPALYKVFYLERALNGLGTILLSTLVDHFEELVYTAETPIVAESYEAVMASVCAQYEGLEEALGESILYSPFEYAQLVTIPHPAYYLNYATSELASMSLYVLAQEEGYSYAQKAFRLLQEGVGPTADFLTAIDEAGLLSPFAEQTYIDLGKVFRAE